MSWFGHVPTRVSGPLLPFLLMLLPQIPLPEQEKQEALGIAQRWQQLVNDAKTRDLRLVFVKEQFREVGEPS